MTEKEKKSFKIDEVCKLIANDGIYWCGGMAVTPSKNLYYYLKELFIGIPLHIFAYKPYREYDIIDLKNIHPDYGDG